VGHHEFAILVAKEGHIGDSQRYPCGSLLGLADPWDVRSGHARVKSASIARSDDAVAHLHSGGSEFRNSSTGAEIDVIWVRCDYENSLYTVDHVRLI
jgi:hypothetical protein